MSNYRHGYAGTRTHGIWESMKNRCDNPRNRSYHKYGARGISYDPVWSDFAAFLADMGEAPAGLQLDRVDNSKSYSKDNCRWATPAQQAQNRRSNRLDWSKVRQIRWLGEMEYRPAAIARMYGVSIHVLTRALRGRTWREVQPVRERTAEGAEAPTQG